MFIGLISSTQESSAPMSIPPINLSSSFPPPPPRIPSTNPIDLPQLRNTHHAARGIARSLTQPRPKKSKHRQDRREGPRDTNPSIKSKKFLVVVTPHNESESPKVPRKGSAYYTTLENQGFIKTIQFQQSSADYCRKRILDYFADLPLTAFQFYRGDSRSLNLTLSTVFNSENCNLDALKR
jgi:hypothetical protein